MQFRLQTAFGGLDDPGPTLTSPGGRYDFVLMNLIETNGQLISAMSLDSISGKGSEQSRGSLVPRRSGF